MLATALAIMIQKADRHPDIWYSWVVNDKHVVPGLLLFAVFCFAVSVGQWRPIQKLYWGIFSRLIPPPPTTLLSIGRGLVIESAKWSCTVFPDHSENITGTLQRQAVGRDLLELRAHQDDWGDICARHGGAGHQKRLEVDFTYRGNAVVQYGQRQTIPFRDQSESSTAETHQLDQRILRDVEGQLAVLTRFEMFALWQLLLKGGMSGEHFEKVVSSLGFPVLTLADQNTVINTFQGISSKTSFLSRDFTTAHWSIKNELRVYLDYSLKARSPLLG